MNVNYLNAIIEHKRSELEVLKNARPPKELIDMASGCPREKLSLKESLLNRQPAIIAEIKRRSPSKGALRSIDDPVDIALQLAGAGAAAISVLTDRFFFGGDLEELRNIRKQVAIPVLRKDFIIDPYQVYESKLYGADAILLISGCLSRDSLKELYNLSYELKIEVLLEVENAEDLSKIGGLQVEIIGVNNRNLHSFSESDQTSIAMAEHLPAEAVWVSESGISGARRIADLDRIGYRGFLIGEALMRSEHPGDRLRTMIKQFDELRRYEKDSS